MLETFWEACENAVKMSHRSWHRTGLMDCIHPQHRLCVCVWGGGACVCVMNRYSERILSGDTQNFYRRCQRPTTSLLLQLCCITQDKAALACYIGCCRDSELLLHKTGRPRMEVLLKKDKRMVRINKAEAKMS